jgi:hypothetical protein
MTANRRSASTATLADAAPGVGDEPPRRRGETCGTRWIVAAACALAAFAAPGAGVGASEVAPGTPIVAVRIERHDIYDLDDPATSGRAYRWIDALHVLTRENFIRSLLLFQVGDALDPLRLAESELILRSTGFLNPVTISAQPVPGGAEVVVETRDQWTIGVDFAYNVSGNRESSGGSVSDDNLLGMGKRVLLDFSSDPERRSMTVGYRDLTFFGSRWQLDLKYTDSTDGFAHFLRVQYPFFALKTPRAGGVEWRQEVAEGYLWSEGERAVTGAADTRDFETWFGLRLPGEGIRTDRLIVGLFGERARFGEWSRVDGSPYPRPADRDLLGAEAGWEHQTFRWKVVQGFRSWHRQEDLPLGPNWRLTAGFSSPALGGDRPRLRYRAVLDVGRWRERTYMWMQADLAGRFESGGLSNAISHLELGGAMTGKAGFRLRAAADLGHELDGERQLTLGADTGLRGYDPNSFDGTSRVVANVEWRRRLTGEFLHVAVLGLTAFVDGGKTWGARVGPSTEGWRSDVGAGLLLEITRASVVRIVRLEVALPDRGGQAVFQITSQSLF